MTWSISTPLRMGFYLSPSQDYPSIKFASTYLYTGVERCTVRVKCLARDYNTPWPGQLWPHLPGLCYNLLVYTTQVNSAFRALWLVHSEVISQYYSPPSNWRERFLNFWPLFTLKITFWLANYSACVVYTKTIIHLSVGESDGYLPPLRWMIVNYLMIQMDWFCLI